MATIQKRSTKTKKNKSKSKAMMTLDIFPPVEGFET